MQDEEIIVGGCDDAPDDRDFKFEEVLGSVSSATSTKSCINKRTSVLNQALQELTYYACTIYGLTACVNEEDAIEDERVESDRPELDPLAITKDVISKNLGFNVKLGWYLQNALKYFVSAGYIDWYLLLNSPWKNDWVLRMERAIDKGMMVYTGSKLIDWKATKNNWGNVVFGSSYGHAFCITGYERVGNRTRFHIRNSYGEGKFDKGYCYIMGEDIDKLFSIYAIVDKLNTFSLLSHKAKVKGIWNGERANDIATEEEVKAMKERSWKVAIPIKYKTREEIAVYCVM